MLFDKAVLVVLLLPVVVIGESKPVIGDERDEHEDSSHLIEQERVHNEPSLFLDNVHWQQINLPSGVLDRFDADIDDLPEDDEEQNEELEDLDSVYQPNDRILHPKTPKYSGKVSNPSDLE